MAIGQCRSGGITVVTVAPAHGAEDVVPDNEISGGSPFDMGLTMSAPKKKKKKKIVLLVRNDANILIRSLEAPFLAQDTPENLSD